MSFLLYSFRFSFVKLPENWGFTEIYGFEEELLCMIPQPCLGVLLLFDCNSSAIVKRHIERKNANESEQSNSVFFANQLLSKSCATLSMMHVIANNLSQITNLPSDSLIPKFVKDNTTKSPLARGVEFVSLSKNDKMIQRAKMNAQNINFDDIDIHEGDTEVHPHFICFILHEGIIYELDPSFARPLSHGASNGNLLLVFSFIILLSRIYSLSYYYYSFFSSYLIHILSFFFSFS